MSEAKSIDVQQHHLLLVRNNSSLTSKAFLKSMAKLRKLHKSDQWQIHCHAQMILGAMINNESL